jgi:cell division protein FtsQ
MSLDKPASAANVQSRRPTTASAPLRGKPMTKPRARLNIMRLLTLLGTLVIIAATGYGVQLAVRKVYSQKIERVRIEGTLNFVKEDEIKAAVGSDVANSLITVDLAQLKQKLEALPWIRKAEIRREWPDAINIYVEEEIPIARWGDKQLLNQQGQVFAPDNTEDQQLLPLLAGPDGSEQKVMRQYQEFNQLLYPLGMRIRDLTFKGNGAYELTLTNNVHVRLGREAVLERLRRLVVFLESEHGRDLQNVEAIDLRYRNGLAVARRPAITEADSQDGFTDSLVAR